MASTTRLVSSGVTFHSKSSGVPRPIAEDAERMASTSLGASEPPLSHPAFLASRLDRSNDSANPGKGYAHCGLCKMAVRYSPFVSGLDRWKHRDIAPALAPETVRASGSPPKAAACRFVHLMAVSWSLSPNCPAPVAGMAGCAMNPRTPRRYWLDTYTAPVAATSAVGSGAAYGCLAEPRMNAPPCKKNRTGLMALPESAHEEASSLATHQTLIAAPSSRGHNQRIVQLAQQ
jgi:hypothetical protein